MYAGSVVGQQRIGWDAMRAVSPMIPPETARSAPYRGCRPIGFLVSLDPRSGEARPGRGGRAGAGQRTPETARTPASGSTSGGSSDPAAHRCGRDGAAPRLRHRAPPVDRVPHRFSATGEGRRVVALDRQASAPVGRADGSPRPADVRSGDNEWLDCTGGLRFGDSGRLRSSAVLGRRRLEAGTETQSQAVHEHDCRYRHSGLRSADRPARGRRACCAYGTCPRASEGEAGEAGPRPRASEAESGETREARENGEAREIGEAGEVRENGEVRGAGEVREAREAGAGARAPSRPSGAPASPSRPAARAPASHASGTGPQS